MSVLAAAALAGAAAAVLVAVPRVAAVRLEGVTGTGPAGGTARRHPAGLLAGATTSRAALPGRAHPPLRGARTTSRRRLAGAAVVALLAVGVVLGPVVAALSAAGAVALLRWRTRRRHERASRAERDGAVEACGALAAELRAGRSPAEALDAAAAVAAGPFGVSLRSAAATERLGGDVAASLLAPVAGSPSAVAPVLRALAACWAVCAGTGAGLASAVEHLADGLRADRAQRRALDAELASPRATAGLLAVLPAAGLLMAVGLGADPVHVLLHTPLGLVCLAVGLGLDALGVVWTSRLVAGASRSI